MKRSEEIEHARCKVAMISFLPIRKKFFRTFGDMSRVEMALDVTAVVRPTQTDVVHDFQDQIDNVSVLRAKDYPEVDAFLEELPDKCLVIIFRPTTNSSFLHSLVRTLRDSGHVVVFLENKRMIRPRVGVFADLKNLLRPIWYRFFRSKFKGPYQRPEVDLLLTNDPSACVGVFAEFRVKKVARVRHMDALVKHEESLERSKLAYGLLIDANLPFHPEHKQYAADLNIERYFKQLKCAMKAYMQRYGLRHLEFSRHPNSDGREVDHLNWPTITQFKTHELAAMAERIVSTGSDASGLAPQIGVPGHVLVLPEVTSPAWVERQKKAAESFGAGVLEYRTTEGLVETQSPKRLRALVRSATWKRFYASDAPDVSQFIDSWIGLAK